MSTKTVERVVELWPDLPEPTRQIILELAEAHAAAEGELELTPEEERLLEQGLDDFKHGRTLTRDEFEARSAAFVESLRKASVKAS